MSTNNREKYFYGMYNDGRGDCFYHSILQLVNLFKFKIITVTNLRFAICYVVTKRQPSICLEVCEAFRGNKDCSTYNEYVNSLLKPGQ